MIIVRQKDGNRPVEVLVRRGERRPVVEAERPHDAEGRMSIVVLPDDEATRLRWQRSLTAEVMGEFRRFGKVFGGDDLVSCRKVRRIG